MKNEQSSFRPKRNKRQGRVRLGLGYCPFIIVYLYLLLIIILIYGILLESYFCYFQHL